MSMNVVASTKIEQEKEGETEINKMTSRYPIFGPVEFVRGIGVLNLSKSLESGNLSENNYDGINMNTLSKRAPTW